MPSVAPALASPPAADPGLKDWVEELVEQKVLELLGDPDSGLTLRPEVEARLKRSFAKELSQAEQAHLEEEFAGYEQRYPCE